MPAVLKTRRLGYDGKGQAVIHAAAPASRTPGSVGRGARRSWRGSCAFDRELSIVAVRGRDGRVSLPTRWWRTSTATGSCALRWRRAGVEPRTAGGRRSGYARRSWTRSTTSACWRSSSSSVGERLLAQRDGAAGAQQRALDDRGRARPASSRTTSAP